MAQTDPYWVDIPKRISDIQKLMGERGIDVYLGSRIRTMSFIVDAFVPWRSYIVIPAEGEPCLFTFVIDASRILSETWMDEDHVRGYFGAGGAEQAEVVAYYITDELGIKGGRLGYETGMATYTAEGWLTKFEYDRFTTELPDFEFINAHEIVDRASLIKDEGTINRFREAGRIVDEGHKAARAALENGGWKGMTETELGGIAALAMRRQGSVSEWNFAGLNEISSGWRTGLGACTPPTTKQFEAGDSLMFDLHAMFKLALGDHSHNYIIGPANKRQRWHAENWVKSVQFLADRWKAGSTPGGLITDLTDLAEAEGFSDFLLPGIEHGIGLFGDEWRVGASIDTPIPYWTDPDHVYQENEMVILACQYAAPDDNCGFRYENPVVVHKDHVELTSKYPLGVEEIE
ncbi:MAG: M24 family metallopeptidase [Candidatus Geothermincolia bacterium]